MEATGIISKVDKPTNWCAVVQKNAEGVCIGVVQEKSGGVCICVDLN